MPVTSYPASCNRRAATELSVPPLMPSMDIDKEVRFVACGSEEVVLKGSYAYVDSFVPLTLTPMSSDKTSI